MERRFDFKGTGGSLFVKFLVGMILSAITFGIYFPWFMVSIIKYVYENTTYGKTAKGDLKFEFTGTGGRLFVIELVGVLLSIVTIGIYLPWFMVKLTRFMSDNSTAKAEDGTAYRLRFQGSGGSLFVIFIVGYLLSMITLGIYLPWFICKLNKYFAANTEIVSTDAGVGKLDFVGQGGDLFVTFLVGYLLTLVTLGIYGAWFAVKITAFNRTNLRAAIGGATFGGGFSGTGGQLFVKILVGYLLSIVTLGIYGAWFAVDLLKYYLNNTFFKEAQPQA